MSQARQQIEAIVESTFLSHRIDAFRAAREECGKILASGKHPQNAIPVYQEAVNLAVKKTLDELQSLFSQQRKSDPKMFWDITETKIVDLSLTSLRSAIGSIGRQFPNWSINAEEFRRPQEHALALLRVGINGLVNWHRQKSEPIPTKSPEDRRAHGVPDVAIMMWFPNSKSDPEEVRDLANAKYTTIKNAAEEASGGNATALKFDDPLVVPQDRISSSLETWLAKAAVVICDLSGQRHNVYYEFGYARASSTDLILTCPDIETKQITFHLSQWPYLQYADLVELRAKLVPALKVLLSKHNLSDSPR